LKRSEYKKMIWSKTARIESDLPLKDIKEDDVRPNVYPNVFPNVAHQTNQVNPHLIDKVTDEVLNVLSETMGKKSKIDNKRKYFVKNNNIHFSLRISIALRNILIELKNIIGTSMAGVIKTAIIHLYADMKKGIEIWQ